MISYSFDDFITLAMTYPHNDGVPRERLAEMILAQEKVEFLPSTVVRIPNFTLSARNRYKHDWTQFNLQGRAHDAPYSFFTFFEYECDALFFILARGD